MSRINGHKVEHFETPADNVDSLKYFYYSLFGWQFTKGQTQARWMIKNAGISGGLMQKENPEQISMSLCVILYLAQR
jgi:predicted enzyme related to lactoylglutathione lyase